ncbi:MAG TPA: PQQ-dependent sugar dehydrogenase, partial [Armatimonadota bacterium]|nr:PQQ-dependent sugar dehydrogenase [Armatimonadota bacterium]
APPRPAAERVVGGLREPVALAFLSPTVLLVAERRAGRIRWVEHGALRDEPFATLPVPNPAGYHEYGLLGLAVDPRYPDRPYVYAFHTVPGRGGGADGQRIVRFTVQDGKGTAPATIVDGLPVGTRCCHNGGRLLFGADGMLYVTLGDTQRPELAQDYGALPGKVLRYTPDGGVPPDNPLEEQRVAPARTDAQAQQTMPSRRTPVYTIGHRNPFGIAMSPAGDLYLTENGPDHDDEINRLVAGDNYGWPVVMGRSSDAHFRNPLWASGRAIIAPTGAAFYTGDALPAYHGNLFFASYTDGRLRRVVFDDRDHISDIGVVPAAGDNARLDVAMGLDGHLYYSSLDAVYRLRAE